MTGINQTLKNKFIYFSGAIILLCILVLILQYNNFFTSSHFINSGKLINNSKLYTANIQILHQQFVKNEIFDERLYESAKSNSIDSLSGLVTRYLSLLDTISKEKYISSGNIFSQKIKGLKSDCKNLITIYNDFNNLIQERGFFNTGKSGEWFRFGKYLEELALSYKNPSIIKTISGIEKEKNNYIFQKKSENVKTIAEQINFLKIVLNTKNKEYTNGLSESDRLKFIKELENFEALTIALNKFDIQIGLCGNSGKLNEINHLISTIDAKSNSLHTLFDNALNEHIFRAFIIRIAIIVLLGFLFLIITYTFLNKILLAVNEIKRFASELVLGKLPLPLNLKASSDLKSIAELFNSFIDSLREKIKFAFSLKSGGVSATLIPLSDDDALSNALLDMEKSLQKAEEEDQKYKEEEKKRAWANEGLAKFSEILRMQTDNLTTLSDAIIVHLVKYLNAIQGSIFLYNDDNPYDIHLELVSSFAYDRKKFLKKRIEIGEGLVGTCAQEKLTIFVSDIPENYIEITSGLGDAPPRSILIVPLKTEENIFGILEIASFTIFNKNEIDFVEKIAESIASTFATVKININTARLLQQSKKQAEEMAQQEEEMRQNLEELQATQEESARKEAEISSLAAAIDASALVVQTDLDGRIIEVNKKFAKVLNQPKDELMGRYLKNIFTFNADTDEFYNLIHELKQGKGATRNEQVLFPDGSTLHFEMHYSPISDRDGTPYKVLAIASDLSNEKNLERMLKEKESEVSSINMEFSQFSQIISEGFIKCTLAPDGTILECNDIYTEITGYNPKELIGINYRKFLKQDELKQFELIWTEVSKDKSYKGVIKRTKPTGDEHWLMASFIPFKNSEGSIVKIFLLALDITEKKLKYQVLEEANKEIERLKGLQNQA
jgi:methyl-accepting chemotaxis protein